MQLALANIHCGTNQAWRWAATLIITNVLSLCQTTKVSLHSHVVVCVCHDLSFIFA